MRQYGRIYDASAPWRAAHLARGGGCTLCCSCSRRRFKHSSSPVGPSTELSRASAQSPPLGFLGSSLSSSSLLWPSLPSSRCRFFFSFFSCARGWDQRLAQQWPGNGQAAARREQALINHKPGGRQAGGRREARAGQGAQTARVAAWRCVAVRGVPSCASSSCRASPPCASSPPRPPSRCRCRCPSCSTAHASSSPSSLSSPSVAGRKGGRDADRGLAGWVGGWGGVGWGG